MTLTYIFQGQTFVVYILTPSTLGIIYQSQWFLNPSPNQAGDAQWAAPAWFGKIFKNH
jgi:hypothetical protein